MPANSPLEQSISKLAERLSTGTSENWLSKALDEVDAELVQQSKHAAQQSASAHAVLKQMRTDGSFSTFVSAYVKENFNQLDIDGNGHISVAELESLTANGFVRRGFSSVELQVLDYLKRNNLAVSESKNDEWGAETTGISLKDAEVFRGKKAPELADAPADLRLAANDRKPADGSLPELIVDFGTERFADLDLDRNGHVSQRELEILESGRFKKALTDEEKKRIADIKGELNKLEKSNNDEWFRENDGATLADFSAYARAESDNAKAFPKKPGDHRIALNVEGVERTALVHIPPSYDGKTKMPVVVFLHSMMSDADEAAELTELSQKADKEGFIVVYPDARGWFGDKLRTWNIGSSPIYQVSDVDFVKTIIDTSKRSLNVDGDRVYVAGFSNGGMLAYEVGSKLSDRVAAIACVSGCMTGKETMPKEPVSTLIVHGTDDGIVPMRGAEMPMVASLIGIPSMKPVSYARDFWAKSNNVDQTSKEEIAPGICVECITQPESKVEVKQYIIKGGRHGFPGSKGPSIDGPVSQDINTTDIMWDFFKRQRKTAGR